MAPIFQRRTILTAAHPEHRTCKLALPTKVHIMTKNLARIITTIRSKAVLDRVQDVAAVRGKIADQAMAKKA